MRFTVRLAAWASALSAAFIVIPAAAQYSGSPPPGAQLPAGVQACVKCHKDQIELIAPTKHAVTGDSRTPFGSGKECAACHGDATEHLKAPTKVMPPNPVSKTKDPTERSQVCLTCHQGGTRIHWQGSAHDVQKIACSECHNSHAPKDQVLVTATQAGVCFTCHKDVRAAVFRLSSHPIKQGLMSCSACHAPHGSVSSVAQLIKQNVNETCYTCHAAQRGPFLWDHPPVREGCETCHNPHGTNTRPMLNARAPFLCQQCHVMGQHPTNLRSGTGLPSATLGPSGQPIGNANTPFLAGNACANCHSKVHGSNHPSGQYLSR